MVSASVVVQSSTKGVVMHFPIALPEIKISIGKEKQSAGAMKESLVPSTLLFSDARDWAILFLCVALVFTSCAAVTLAASRR